MLRILFVDSETHLLNGLRRTLRSMRHEWAMEFSSDPAEALSFFEDRHVDVIVSDIRMPGMNGIELLTQVKQQYPDTVRILLSGQSDEKVTLNAIGPVHQYLSKPCDINVLKDTFTRIYTLGNLLENESLKEVVSRVDKLPTIPALYHELELELQSPECSINRVADIISQDIGMTTQILKLVNSAFFGLNQNIVEPIQAVVYLGVDTIRTLVLTIQVFDQMKPTRFKGFDMDKFTQHSWPVGKLARKIMLHEKVKKGMVEETLTAAMLHDLGSLLLVNYFAEGYQQCINVSQEEDFPFTKAEYHVLGTSHAEVGAYLLGLWGLTTPIIEAVAYHHIPGKCSHREFSPLTVVHVAEVFATLSPEYNFEDLETKGLDLKYLREVGVENKLRTWFELKREPELTY